MKNAFATLLFLIAFLRLPAQMVIPNDYFRSPLDTVLLLSASFGEIRAGHLHSGIDIKVFEKEGMPVLAVADGFVVRVKVSPVGFGNALYIDHPNGFTSVYGHLQRFSSEIQKYIRKEQYERESFDVDVFPGKDLIRIKKGDTIGYAGNSGTSFGPHLHFELRDTKTERPINPLHFGYNIKDTLKPIISSLIIYPFGDSSSVNKNYFPVQYPLEGTDTLHPSLIAEDTLCLAGKIYFGIETEDLMYNQRDKNGVYSVELFIDSTLCFSQALDSFAFDETRYVNAMIDFNYWMHTGRKIIKTYISPGNKLPVYRYVANQGIFDFSAPKLHLIRYEVSDFSGNKKVLQFYAKGNFPFPQDYVNEPWCNDDTLIFYPDRKNSFKNEDIEITIPAGALYDTLLFSYSSDKIPKGCFSKLYHIQNPFSALQKNMTVSVKTEGLPEKYQQKALLVRINENHSKSAVNSTFENGFVIAKTNTFGDYAVTIDAIPPQIKPLNIPRKHHITRQKNLEFLITDNLSGIKSYRGTLNGQWILMEYDAKSDKLIYRFDDRLHKGKNDLRIVVTDECKNSRTFSSILYY